MSEEKIELKSGVEIVDHVVSWFSTHPRSAGETGCKHIMGSRRCAFALICKDDPETNRQLKKLEGKTCFAHIEPGIWLGMLRPEFAGHNPEFYRSLQQLHDTDVNWVENTPGSRTRTLSSAGVRQEFLTKSKASF